MIEEVQIPTPTYIYIYQQQQRCRIIYDGGVMPNEGTAKDLPRREG